MKFFKTIKADLLHSLSGSHFQHPVSLNFFNIIKSFFVKEFKAILIYRCYHALNKKGFRIFVFLLYEYSKRRYGVDIAPQANLDEGIRIAHCSDIVIGPNAKVGFGTVIFNGVTLGKRNPGKKGGMPIIGKHVTLGTGAKVLGEVVIGDHAKVGANSVVISSVPAYATAVGIPAVVKVGKDGAKQD